MTTQVRLTRRALLGGSITGAVILAGGGLALLDDRGGAPPAPTPPAGGASNATATPAAARVEERPDGYLAVAPRVLRAGRTEAVSLSLFRDDRAASGAVTLALIDKEGRQVAEASGYVPGRGLVALNVPPLDAGDYQLRVAGQGFRDQAPLRVEDGTLLFVETDKPIYKPGQTVRIRVLALDAALKPVAGRATVEVMDAKGIKVFKKPVAIDDFGLAALDLPLSTEPNLGTWKVRAAAGQRSAQLDVKVERYVLPKYEIKVQLPKSWALANEAIAGTVAAEYSFGKPVKGEVEIVASRYAGTWQEYARVTRPIDGKLAFDLPPVRYAAGSPAANGLASVRLAVTVREQETGYEEQTEQLVTIAARPVTVRLVPESGAFKPGLPFNVLVTAETPDKQAADADVQLRLIYQGLDYRPIREETKSVAVRNGAAAVQLTAPADAAILLVQPAAGNAAGLPLTLRAAHSPSGAFIHLAQTTTGALKVGDTARFKVSATREARNFYYEVLARGKVVFADFSPSPEIALTLSPAMAPEARLLVYQVLGAAEVAVDWLPFKVSGAYPQQVAVTFDKPEAKPGEALDVRVQAGGAARVGLAAVDRSVFILAENRLNLQQVFAEIERLYQAPQAELHQDHPGDPVPLPEGRGRPGAPGGGPAVGAPAVDVAGPGASPYQRPTSIPGAKETFQGAGVVVLTNRKVPEGKKFEQPKGFAGGRGDVQVAAGAAQPPAGVRAATAAAAAPAAAAADAREAAPAEPARIRQFFPETWLWEDLTTDAAGRATRKVTAPDTITTWMFRAVALSKEQGLGIGEAELRVFQPFFAQVDLPYAAIRGEEFPAQVALYNYGQTAQQFTVELEPAPWFDLLDSRTKTVTVAPNSVGAAAFTIRPTALGVGKLQVTARGQSAADALIKELIVEPEGVQREEVENLVLAPGAARNVPLAVPAGVIPGSSRAYVALTGNVLSQAIQGLESLIRMPYGCGEQNMLLFAPTVFVTRYLKETGQLKPEALARAEALMLTGYQRELTYRRADGSFSAFGQSDKDGSLWLTAFVLKTFAQSKELIFIDDGVLTAARDWIRKGQKSDGAFDPIGFVHHKELLGGVSGRTALTAYVAIALREAGDVATAAPAIRYLEGQLAGLTEPYALAIVTYALALAQSPRAAAATAQLLALAKQSDDGIYWEGNGGQPVPLPQPQPAPGVARPEPSPHPRPGQSLAVETTAYAALALLQTGDRLNAGGAVRWLAARRNPRGGFGSTQDTVVALQALTAAATSNRADVDATVTLAAGSWRKDVRVTPDNADTVQIVEVPTGGALDLVAAGKGQVLAQAVHRYNVPAAEVRERSAFQLDVRYGADRIEVDDLLDVTATVRFTPPVPVPAAPASPATPPAARTAVPATRTAAPSPGVPIQTGMVVLDIAVPTGFAPETATLEALARRERRLKRWDIAGRKVIFYIEDLAPNESLTITFQARALYPVRAQAVTSQAYAYYRPEWKGESLGGAVEVRRK